MTPTLAEIEEYDPMSISEPKTLAEAKTYRYRVWAGNPTGYQYDPSRCAAEVHDGYGGCLFHQCQRKNGHGPEGIYCAYHAKRYARTEATR